jgi:hypothetical protein
VVFLVSQKFDHRKIKQGKVRRPNSSQITCAEISN